MNLNALKNQLEVDGIEYLLVQFVDIHGAPKVKMVPTEALVDVTDIGAGFAGGAVWGMGQDASSHDMMARADLATYTPLPWKPGLARFLAQNERRQLFFVAHQDETPGETQRAENSGQRQLPGFVDNGNIEV